MSVYYELNIELDASIKVSFLAYLLSHMKEVMTVGSFNSGKILKLIDDPFADKSVFHFKIIYEIENETLLSLYFKNHAPRLRQEAIDKFGDKFKVTRQVYEDMNTFQLNSP